MEHNSLIISKDSILSADLQDLHQSAQNLFAESLSPATRRAYQTDWACFCDFCAEHGFNPADCTPSDVVLFLTHQAQIGKAPQTLQRRLAAIKFMYELSGRTAPVDHKMITSLMRGVRRVNAGRVKQSKKPLRMDMLEQILRLCDLNSLQGIRDYAILLFGFSGAFRRSEICALRVDDLTETPDGLKVNIRTSKTDQDGQGHIIAIPHGQKFPVTMALKKWLQMAQIHQGFVFRRVHKGGKTVGDALQPLAVSQILKSYITRIGYNADEYGAHSLRSGFLTEAAEHGASLFKILEISRHKSTDMILHYIKSAELFKDHAGKDFL